MTDMLLPFIMLVIIITVFYWRSINLTKSENSEDREGSSLTESQRKQIQDMIDNSIARAFSAMNK